MNVITHHVNIARSPFLLRNNLDSLHQVLRLIEDYDIRLIHCHTPVGGLIGRLAAALTRRRKPYVIYTAHGFHFYEGAPMIHNLIYGTVERLLARLTDMLIVINSEDHTHASRFRLKRDGHVFMIPGVGLDTSYFRPFPPELQAAYRRDHGIDSNAFLIMTVGELNENKNQLVVLKALRSVLDASPGEQIHYGICGDGFFRNKMKEQTKQLRLQKHVTMFGYCRDVREYIAMANVIVFPSRREGLGMSALEAMSMGVPVIVADNRGTREYIQPGLNGFACQADDAEGYAKHILRLRRMPPEDLAAMGNAARDTAMRFDRQYTRKIMREVYALVDRKVQQL